jgi:hypothetical protein
MMASSLLQHARASMRDIVPSIMSYHIIVTALRILQAGACADLGGWCTLLVSPSLENGILKIRSPLISAADSFGTGGRTCSCFVYTRNPLASRARGADIV